MWLLLVRREDRGQRAARVTGEVIATRDGIKLPSPEKEASWLFPYSKQVPKNVALVVVVVVVVVMKRTRTVAVHALILSVIAMSFFCHSSRFLSPLIVTSTIVYRE